MYYNRTIQEDFAKQLMVGGQLRWLFDYVKAHSDLDLLTVKNKDREFINIYRGLTKIMSICKTNNPNQVTVEAHKTYEKLCPSAYGMKTISSISDKSIEFIRKHLEDKGENDSNYGKKKEGYYQNELSRKFGICGSVDSDFVIIDKEAVAGYANVNERKELLGPMVDDYKKLQSKIWSIDSKRYGKNLKDKSIGNELDFLAITKEGDLLLIEYKDGSNASGIYLSPLQIGLYFDIFKFLSTKIDLNQSVIEMLEQKKRIGLINPRWKTPKLSGKIIPVLIISNPNYRSSAYEKFQEILDICKKEKGDEFLKDLRTYSYKSSDGLTALIKP